MGVIPSQLELLDRLIEPGMRVLTIGRLTVHETYRAHHRASRNSTYFDDFARHRYPGVSVDHLDASGYQGAAIIQDMNLPLTDENRALSGCYDVILDGGSLEHFFDVPQAIRNYDSFLKVGGFIYISTNANNHFGHGFYQFSSELFYRVFSEENGYEMLDCILEEHPLLAAEISSSRRYFDAVDPATLHRRTQFISNRPVLIHCVARKQRDVEMCRSLIQSDYQEAWSESGGPRREPGRVRSAVKELFDRVPVLWWFYDRWKLGVMVRLGRNSDFRKRNSSAKR